MSSSHNLLNLVTQLQSMEMSFTSILMEAAMKLSAITGANIFVLIETPEGRKISGKRHLCDAYMSGNLSPTGQDVEFEVNPLISALQERQTNLPDTYTASAVFPSAASVPRTNISSSPSTSVSFKSANHNSPSKDVRSANRDNDFQRKRPSEQQSFHSASKQYKPSTSTNQSVSTSRFAEDEMVSVNIKEENDGGYDESGMENNEVKGNGLEHSDHDDDDIGIISDFVG